MGNFQFGDHRSPMSTIHVGTILKEYEIITLIYNGKPFRLDLLCCGESKDINHLAIWPVTKKFGGFVFQTSKLVNYWKHFPQNICKEFNSLLSYFFFISYYCWANELYFECKALINLVGIYTSPPLHYPNWLVHYALFFWKLW